MTNAIIVAAGKSKLCDYLLHPKCLAKIGNERILHRQIRLLKECGVDWIYVATGYGGDIVWNEVINMPYEHVVPINVKWWWQEQQRHYGSYYSTFQLLKITLEDDIIVLLGDIVFSKKALEEMLNTQVDKHGVMMLGKLDACTAGIRIKNDGRRYLYTLPQPYWLSIDPNKPYPIHDISHTALWWHFQWLNQQETGKLEAPFFCPTGYFEDIDDVKDLTDKEIVKNLD